MKIGFLFFPILLVALGAQVSLAQDVTYVDECGTSSTSDDETLLVTQDLQLQSGQGFCIEVSNSHVTLDCQGFVLSTSPLGLVTGIHVLDTGDDVTVRNCMLAGSWFFGIYSLGDENLIEHNDLADVGFGIHLRNSQGSEIRHNRVVGGGWDGIVLNYAVDNFIHHNIVLEKAYGTGITLIGASLNDISHNQTRAGGWGIRLDSNSQGNIVFKNRSTENSRSGIWISDSSENGIVANTANRNDIGIEESGEDLANSYSANVCKANETMDSNIEYACK